MLFPSLAQRVCTLCAVVAVLSAQGSTQLHLGFAKRQDPALNKRQDSPGCPPTAWIPPAPGVPAVNIPLPVDCDPDDTPGVPGDTDNPPEGDPPIDGDDPVDGDNAPPEEGDSQPPADEDAAPPTEGDNPTGHNPPPPQAGDPPPSQEGDPPPPTEGDPPPPQEGEPPPPAEGDPPPPQEGEPPPPAEGDPPPPTEGNPPPPQAGDGDSPPPSEGNTPTDGDNPTDSDAPKEVDQGQDGNPPIEGDNPPSAGGDVPPPTEGDLPTEDDPPADGDIPTDTDGAPPPDENNEPDEDTSDDQNPTPDDADEQPGPNDPGEGEKVTVTGEDDVVVTYAPAQNPDYTDETATATITSTSTRDDDEIIPVIIPVGPGGWFWSMVGPGPGPGFGPVPPPPTIPPGPPGPPGGNNPDGNDGSDNQDDDSEDKDDDEDDEDDEDEDETTSCTTTITATYASVFCSVVSGEARPDDCVTSVYDTSTACETIHGSTTTTTETPEETRFCSPETCGDDNCEARRSLSKRAAPEPQRFPHIGDWFTPAHYGGDSRSFMRGEVARAYNRVNGAVGVAKNVLGVYKSTSAWVEFNGLPATVALKGLWGCTGVAVVSKKGAWLGHFWETNPYAPGQRVIDETWRGSKDPDEDSDDPRPDIKFNPKGLRQLREENIFSDDVKIWVFTPRPRRAENGEDNLDEDGGQNVVFDTAIHEVVMSKLQEIFPGVERKVEFYSPLLEVNGRRGTDDRSRAQILGDDAYDSHRGKFMVKYQPARTRCTMGEVEPREVAQYRVWKEGKPLGQQSESEWQPLQGQTFSSNNNKKRQGDGGEGDDVEESCEVDSEDPKDPDDGNADGGDDDRDDGGDDDPNDNTDDDDEDVGAGDETKGWECTYDPPRISFGNMLGVAWCDCKHKDGDKVRLHHSGECSEDCNKCEPWKDRPDDNDDNDDDENEDNKDEDEDEENEDEDEEDEVDESEGWECTYDPPSITFGNMLGAAWCDCKHEDGDEVRLHYDGECSEDCGKCEPWKRR